MPNKPLANWTPSDGIPSTIADHVANSTARLAYTHFPGKTAFDSADIGKVIMQDDDQSTWICVSVAPLTWRRDDSVSTYGVPDLATLTALTDPLVGQKVRVESLGRSYEFTPAGTSPASGITVINCALGQWHSLEGTSDPKFQYQDTWYVDGTAGNDEGDGSLAQPVSSIDEIFTRLGGANAKVQTNVTINVVSNPIGPTIFTLKRASLQYSVTFKSAAPVNILAQGTLASYTAPSTVNNEVTVISVTGINDFTSLVGAKVNFGIKGVARIAAVNPSGLGVQYARITVPKIDNDYGTPATGSPTIGQEVTIEGLGPDLGDVSAFVLGISGINPTSPYYRPAVYFKGLQASKSFTLATTSMSRWASSREFRVFDCDVIDLSASGTEAAVFSSSLRYFSKFDVEARCTACLFIAKTANDITSIYPRTLPGGSCMLECVVEKMNVLCYEAAINLASLAVFDATGDGVAVHNGASLYVTGWLIGKGNTGAGIAFSGVGNLVLASAVLAITGNAGQIKTPNGAYITAADVPRQWHQGSVELVLSGGTRNVTIPALPSDTRVVGIVRKTASGGIGNTLTYTIVGTTLTVTSSDATEASTLEVFWVSPSSRIGGITA